MSAVSNRKFPYFKLYINNLSQRFAYASKCTYNSLSDFPTTGSGFGVNKKVLTLYTGFDIPEFSRICFMNYGNSPDAALSAVSPSGDIYSAFRNSDVWQNGKVSVSKDDLPQAGSTAVIDCPAGAIKEASVTFPKAFATTPIVVISPLSDTQSINGIPKYSVKEVTTDGFLIKLYNDDNDTRSPVFYWMAMRKQ